MARTKKDEELIQNLTLARDMARALRWPEGERPQPMTAKEVGEAIKAGGENVVEVPTNYGSKTMAFAGWKAMGGISFSRPVLQIFRVYACDTTHARVEEGRTITRQTGWAQGHGNPYRTREEALSALRFQETEAVAAFLLAIDNA